MKPPTLLSKHGQIRGLIPDSWLISHLLLSPWAMGRVWDCRCRQTCWVTFYIPAGQIIATSHNLGPPKSKGNFLEGKSTESRSVNNYNLARSWVMCNHLGSSPIFTGHLKNLTSLTSHLVTWFHFTAFHCKARFFGGHFFKHRRDSNVTHFFFWEESCFVFFVFWPPFLHPKNGLYTQWSQKGQFFSRMTGKEGDIFTSSNKRTPEGLRVFFVILFAQTVTNKTPFTTRNQW